LFLNVSEILRGIPNARLAWEPSRQLRFSNVTNDSRLAKAGSLFVALQGERDGHDFIANAYSQGARGVIAEREIDVASWLPAEAQRSFLYVVTSNSLEALQQLATYWRTSHLIPTVGITGSYGKTTTKELVARVLGARFDVLRNEKNLNNEIGVPLTILQLRSRHEVAVIEMGMYALGEIAELSKISQPRIGVVTNVGAQHLERLGSIECIAQAKSELIQALPRDGIAILNGDDQRVRAMATLGPSTVITYGLGEDNTIRATDIVHKGLEGLEFTLAYPEGQARVTTSLLGNHSIYAYLAAAAVGFQMGLSVKEIKERLRRPAQSLRLKLVKGPAGSTIIDDTYNAGPASTIAALDVLSSAQGRRIAILADMAELGDFEEAGHREVGRKAAASVDTLITVGPRARWIAEEAQAHGLVDVRAVSAKQEVDLRLTGEDTVLVKGSRGMKMEDVVAQLLKQDNPN
jgi:UDP-N-acetylmuramoyl-tripeptide--D-alanyl-D-alanine ligase